MGEEDYQELFSFLRRFTVRVRRLRAAETLCLAAIFLTLLFSLGLAVREVKAIFPYAPLLYAIFTALVLFPIGARALFNWRRLSPEGAALLIEKKCPHLRNNLINSLQLYPQISGEKEPQGLSTAMVLALLRATRKQVQHLNPEDLVGTERIRREIRLLSVLIVPVLAAVLFNPHSVRETLGLLIHPLKDLPPSLIQIHVMPKGLRVARGSNVTIQATISGADPKSVELLFSVLGEDPAAEKKISMRESAPARFEATLQDIQQSLRYRVTAGAFSSPSYGVEAVDPPAVGNITITLHPPHYTGLPALTLRGGNAEGIKGSTIRLEATTTKEVVKAEAILDEGREVPLKIEGRKLHGTLVLFQSQKYRIAVEDSLGFRNSPIAYDLRVLPDGFPTVEILNPKEDLEVNGDEALPLEFSARDDFGIREIALVARIGERQERLPIEKDGGRKFIPRDKFQWDLTRLGLRDGEEAIYHLEVLDNDTISGPKIGVSQPLRLRMKNLKKEHQEIAELIRDLSDRMVDLLAEHLENPPEEGRRATADRGFEQKLENTLSRIEEMMPRIEKDRLTDFATWSDLEALKRNLEFTKDELSRKKAAAASLEEKAKVHDEIASELERMSLLSEEMSKRLKAQEVASAARDLIKDQERLLDSIERLRAGDANLDQVLKEISRLAQLLRSLEQALANMATQLPEEFANSEALQGLNFNEMLSALEEIRKKLAQGDVEGAMRLARDLLSQMASMVAALQNAQEMAMFSGLGRMQGEMARSASELDQIAREQQQILQETEEINKKELAEREETLREKLERFLAEANNRLGRLAELFPDEELAGRSIQGPPPDELDEATVNHLTKGLLAQLLRRNFASFAEILGMAQKELQKKRGPDQAKKAKEAEEILERLEAELESLLREPLLALSDEQRKALRDLSHRQGVLRERAEELHEKLNSLFQLFPSLDPKITKNIQEAGSWMEQAKNRLSDLDPNEAIPPEREALSRLSQSRQQMQNALQQLAQRGQLGRMSVARLFRMGRFLPPGALFPLPGMPDFPQLDLERGITGLDLERFKLPGKEDYKAPRSLREEILESLKQGVPQQFKEQIEEYFRNLSE